MTDRPITVALLAMPGVTAATLYGFHDCFAGVHRDWAMLHGGHAESSFRSMVVSRDGKPHDPNEACGTMRTPFAPSSGLPSRLTTIERNGDSAWPP